MGRTLALVVVAIVAVASCGLIQTTSAVTTHVVGDSLGWVAPPAGPVVYATWAASQTFLVGDILLFNFTTGEGDVARVTLESYLTCNSTDPISFKTTGPANFTLDSIGEYFFISTSGKSCILGQKLAVNVTASPGPTQAPSPRGPRNYTVGDDLGWVVPPAGPFFYISWARDKTFFIGDTLVFNFFDGFDDVAVVTKEIFESCNITSTLAVFNSTPTNITLKATGEHYYTSTYLKHCVAGQKLSINVTGNSSSGSSPPARSPPGPGPAHSPSIAVSPSAPVHGGLAPSHNSSPSKNVNFRAFLVSAAMALAPFLYPI